MIVIYALVAGYAALWAICFAVCLTAWIVASLKRPFYRQG